MSVLFRLVKLLWGDFRLHSLFLLVTILIQALLNGLVTLTIAPIADIVLVQNEQTSRLTDVFQDVFHYLNIDLTIGPIFTLIGILLLTVGLLGVLTKYATARIKYDVLTSLLTVTMSKFLSARYEFFNHGDIGELLNSFQKEVDKIGDTFGQIITGFVTAIQLLVFLSVPLIVNTELTLMFIGAGLSATLPLWFMHRLSYRWGGLSTQTSNQVAGILHEILTSAKLIISFGKVKASTDDYRNNYKEHASVAVKSTALVGGLGSLVIPLGTISVLVVLYYAYSNNLPLADIALTLFAFIKGLPLLASLLKTKTTIENFLPAFQQIEKLRKRADQLFERSGTYEFKQLSTDLTLRNVSFEHVSEKLALNNISISIKKGTTVALVGHSGSGKTTVCDLLLGLYQPNHGNFFIDNINFLEYDLQSYRHRVGYVPQESQLFNSTIRDNLLWSSPGSSDDDCIEACRLANAADFVLNLPEGLNTVVGDRGGRLSGGQRQRLALARALIRGPEILVLDEATSSLDSESEMLIQAALDKLKGSITIIVVAHRLASVRNADYLYIFQNGKVVETGRYDELIRNSEGIFHEMVTRQSGIFVNSE